MYDHASIPLRTMTEQVDFCSLIAHRAQICACATLEVTYRQFRESSVDFMAVVDPEGRPLGMCAKRDIGMLLGHPFGNALYSKSMVMHHLHPEPMCIRPGRLISDVLRAVFSRKESYFYDDVILVDQEDRFLGFIPVLTLIRLQNNFLTEKIHQLEVLSHELDMQQQQMDLELKMSGKLQWAMLPTEVPEVEPPPDSMIEAVLMEGRMIPTGEVGGDFYYWFSTSPHSFGVLVCDVMGHGVRSAMITGIIRAHVDRLQEVAADPSAVLAQLNQQINQLFNRLDDVIFVTAVYAHFDLREMMVTLSSAGHYPPLLGHADLPEWSREPFGLARTYTGPALGFYSNAAYHNQRTAIQAGDSFLFYTDGIFEAFCTENEEVGLRRLGEAMQRLSRTKAMNRRLLDAIIGEAGRLNGAKSFSDDICLVAVQLAPHSVFRGLSEDARFLACSPRGGFC